MRKSIEETIIGFTPTLRVPTQENEITEEQTEATTDIERRLSRLIAQTEKLAKELNIKFHEVWLTTLAYGAGTGQVFDSIKASQDTTETLLKKRHTQQQLFVMHTPITTEELGSNLLAKTIGLQPRSYRKFKAWAKKNNFKYSVKQVDGHGMTWVALTEEQKRAVLVQTLDRFFESVDNWLNRLPKPQA